MLCKREYCSDFGCVPGINWTETVYKYNVRLQGALVKWQKALDCQYLPTEELYRNNVPIQTGWLVGWLLFSWSQIDMYCRLVLAPLFNWHIYIYWLTARLMFKNWHVNHASPGRDWDLALCRFNLKDIDFCRMVKIALN